MNKRYRAFVLMAAFIAGAAFAVLVPRLIRNVADRWIFPKERRETARITSPDGTVDAVAEITECGAPCPSTYIVSVVPKGKVRTSTNEQVFIAADTVNAKLQWTEAHLLNVTYDKAFIDSFRNVAYPFGRAGDVQSWNYAVEIRLSPTSPDFSYLGYSRSAKSR